MPRIKRGKRERQLHRELKLIDIANPITIRTNEAGLPLTPRAEKGDKKFCFLEVGTAASLGYSRKLILKLKQLFGDDFDLL